MKFYKLGFSDNLNEMGKIPQAELTKNINSNINDLGYEEPILIPLVPPEPILHSQANKTTILNVVAVNDLVFMVCKKKFINYLSQFIINEFKTWPLKIHYKNELLINYVLFHLSYPSDNEIINFNKSEFFIGQVGDWKEVNKRKSVNIKDYYHYINLREVLSENSDVEEIKHGKIVLNLNKIKNDLFRLEIPVVRGYYASERLKDSILKEGFTGMTFKEINEFDKRIEVRY